MGYKGIVVLHTVGGKKRKMVHRQYMGEHFFEIANDPDDRYKEGQFVEFEVEKALDGSNRQLSTQYAKVKKKMTQKAYWG